MVLVASANSCAVVVLSTKLAGALVWAMASVGSKAKVSPKGKKFFPN